MSAPADYAPMTIHKCWFCSPDSYKPMPEGKTLCARCGDLTDGNKNALDICAQCEQDLEGENK